MKGKHIVSFEEQSFYFMYYVPHITHLVAQIVKNQPAMQETVFNPWGRKIPWRRERQPTPVFLPGEFHGQRSLAGPSPWGHKRVEYD